MRALASDAADLNAWALAGTGGPLPWPATENLPTQVRRPSPVDLSRGRRWVAASLDGLDWPFAPPAPRSPGDRRCARPSARAAERVGAP